MTEAMQNAEVQTPAKAFALLELAQDIMELNVLYRFLALGG
jgi:hypothetical protein